MSELKLNDRKQIAEILDRRANEVASFSSEYTKDGGHFGSVELAQECQAIVQRTNLQEGGNMNKYSWGEWLVAATFWLSVAWLLVSLATGEF